jgi:hypothetical protein
MRPDRVQSVAGGDGYASTVERKAEEQSLGDLFAELSRETSTLVRHEVTLAKSELAEKASVAGRNIGFLAAGGAVAYAGFLVLLAAAVIGLDAFMPAWLAALIVGLVVAAIGYFLVQKGLNTLNNMELAPRETIQSLKEYKEWLQQQI